MVFLKLPELCANMATQTIYRACNQASDIVSITLVAEGEGLKSRQMISLGVWPLTSTNLIFYHASPGYIFNLLDRAIMSHWQTICQSAYLSEIYV